MEESSLVDFSSFDLDPRLTRVLERQNIKTPTLIQEKAIPLALQGKDLLAKAKTGSGKTLSYLLPILHQLLHQQTHQPASAQGVRALILVPTKELARQVTQVIGEFLYYCNRELNVLNLAGDESTQMQKSQLSLNPSILVSTPSRILSHLDSQVISLKDSLRFLVIDEADLVLSFGYLEEVERLAHDHIPNTVQTFLMSATLGAEMEGLKRLVLRSPVILKLEDNIEDDHSKLQQYAIRCKEEDKFLLMYVVLKLKLLNGKLIVFTNETDRCYRLKLFLGQFGIKTCILDAELPTASRHHMVEQFNRGVYDIIISSDLQASDSTSATDSKKSWNSRRRNTREGGVARGVDFKHVDVVINFDLPMQVDSYVHRVGRTARGGNAGTAISFISSSSDEIMLKNIEADQEARGNIITPHDFDLHQLDGFRYRCADALRAVTKKTVKKARVEAIRGEILHSEKLKSFFEERPKDLELLRQDANSNLIPAKPHLKHIPDYLFPHSPNDTSADTSKISSLPQNTSGKHPSTRFGTNKFARHGKSKDPLRSMKVKKNS